MRTSDLKLLFKNVSFKPEDIESYIIDLLSKFEVALKWDENNLLIPSLLPTEQSVRTTHLQMDIRVSKFTVSVQGRVDLWSYIMPIDRYSDML